MRACVFIHVPFVSLLLPALIAVSIVERHTVYWNSAYPRERVGTCGIDSAKSSFLKFGAWRGLQIRRPEQHERISVVCKSTVRMANAFADEFRIRISEKRFLLRATHGYYSHKISYLYARHVYECTWSVYVYTNDIYRDRTFVYLFNVTNNERRHTNIFFCKVLFIYLFFYYSV